MKRLAALLVAGFLIGAPSANAAEGGESKPDASKPPETPLMMHGGNGSGGQMDMMQGMMARCDDMLLMMRDHGNYDYGRDGFTIHSCQLRPDSRGTIMIQSADPFEHPLIDPNYLAAESDRITMRESVKMIREIAGQNALSPIRGKEALPGERVRTDDEIDAFIREYGETIYHPVGTVAMGIQDEAPLDGELKVRGVEGLRVVDASVMPTLIGGNTNAPTIMIAEKTADMIRGIAPLPQESVDVAA